MAICVHRSLGAVSLWCACCRLSQITGLWGVSISISISQFANINASSLWLFEKCASHVSDLPFTLADLSFPLFTTWVSVSSFFFSILFLLIYPEVFLRFAIQIVKVPKRQTLFGLQIHFLRGRGPHINIHLHECSSRIKMRGDFLWLS